MAASPRFVEGFAFSAPPHRRRSIDGAALPCSLLRSLSAGAGPSPSGESSAHGDGVLAFQMTVAYFQLPVASFRKVSTNFPSVAIGSVEPGSTTVMVK